MQTVQLDARDTSSLGVKTLLYNAKDYILSQIKKIFLENKKKGVKMPNIGALASSEALRKSYDLENKFFDR